MIDVFVVKQVAAKIYVSYGVDMYMYMYLYIGTQNLHKRTNHNYYWNKPYHMYVWYVSIIYVYHSWIYSNVRELLFVGTLIILPFIILRILLKTFSYTSSSRSINLHISSWFASTGICSSPSISNSAEFFSTTYILKDKKLKLVKSISVI